MESVEEHQTAYISNELDSVSDGEKEAPFIQHNICILGATGKLFH